MSSVMDISNKEDLWITLVEKFRMQLNVKPGVKWGELGWRWQFGNCQPTNSWKPWVEMKVLRNVCGPVMSWLCTGTTGGPFRTTHIQTPPQT